MKFIYLETSAIRNTITNQKVNNIVTKDKTYRTQNRSQSSMQFTQALTLSLFMLIIENSRNLDSLIF